MTKKNKDTKFDYAKTQLLIEARGKMSQKEVAEYFGLGLPGGRNTVRDWENGIAKPDAVRRERFISYLLDKLALRRNRKKMNHIWEEVMVGQWEWDALQDYEFPKEPPYQIRAPSGPFIGHTKEIAEIATHIRTAIRSGEAALCSLYGMGGVGKTKLAQMIAWQIKNEFPDGDIFLALRGEATLQQSHGQELTPAQSLINVIQEFTYDEKFPEPVEKLAPYFHKILENRKVLILADNARDASQVELLVPPPGCALIVTSRNLINLEGAMRPWHIGVLSPKEASALLLKIHADIGEYAPAIAELCGYLPLALRICASLLIETPMMVVPDFIEQLRAERLTYLVGPKGDPNDPRASVEASISISYTMLDLTMQQIMQQLSVFPSSFDVTAAQAVVQDVKNVAEVLRRLYRLSMVEWNKESKRYLIHDLIRMFCAQRLTDTYAVDLRYAQYYATLVIEIETLYARGESLEALRQFDSERVNIDKGWNWALVHEGETKADMLLITYGDGTRRIGGLRYDRRKDRQRLMQAMLRATRRLKDRAAEGRALHYLGNNYYVLSEIDTAMTHLERAMAIAQEIDAATEMADLDNEIGLVHLHNEDRTEAIEFFESCRVRSQHIPHPQGEAVSLCNLGLAHILLKRPEQAIAYLTDALRISRTIKSKFQESAALTYLGKACLALGNKQQAIEYLEQSRLIDRQLRDREGEAVANLNLGEILIKSDPQRTWMLWQEAHKYADEIGHEAAPGIKAKLDELGDRLNQYKQE